MIRSNPGQDRFNAIDPSLLLDPAGKLWMSFGSFWAGIEGLELDPATGKRPGADTPIYPLAFHKEIEASCLVAHGGVYYLFVDWGLCCRGVRSTYEMRVGRSERATGPYLDRDGVGTLGVRQFIWGPDGWPVPGPLVIAQSGPDASHP